MAGDTLFWVGAVVFAAILVIVALLRPIGAIRWGNDSLQARQANFLRLLDLAAADVVIVTGSLHRSLYEHERILEWLKRKSAAGKQLSFTIYHEYEIDVSPETGINQFLQLVKEHYELNLIGIAAGQIAHGAVVDGEHGKVEERGVADDSPEKSVEYFAFDRARAQSFLKRLRQIPAASMAPPALSDISTAV